MNRIFASVLVMNLVVVAGAAFADPSNTAAGANALASVTTGIQNSAFGVSALQSDTTGYYNTAVGAFSLQNTVSATANTAVGAYSLYSNTATGNTAIGMDALYSNVEGHNNVANGFYALFSNTTGYDNNATGVAALWTNTTGYYNDGVGFYVLSGNTTGHHNVGIGYVAGSTNMNGVGNTFLGCQSDATTYNLTNATAIGWDAHVSRSNSLVLGQNGTNVGIGTSSPLVALDVYDTSYLIGHFKNNATSGDRTAMVRFETGDSTPAMWNIGAGGSGNGIGQTNGQLYLESVGYGVALSVDQNRNIHFYPGGGGSCNLTSGAAGWSCSSDKELKENFTGIDRQGILDRLSAMPITMWNMKGAAEKHIGPVAQDFYAAFSLGEDDRHINTVDANGVSLAAIQALYDVVKKQQKEIDGLKALMRAGCVAGQ